MTKNRLLPALLLLALCGCFKTKDELTLNADGSGTVRLETRLLLDPQALRSSGFGGGDAGPLVYPPTSEDEARRFFPAKNFTVTTKEDSKDGGPSTVIVTAAFKDVNTLLSSPYGKAHGLTLTLTNGTLSLRAVTGIEGAARLAELKDGEEILFEEQLQALGEMKKHRHEMRAEFRVTLPNAAASAKSGGAIDGRSVTWIVDRTKHTNAAEFAHQAGAHLEASCAAEGVKFVPVTPARLGMLSFKDAPAGVVDGGAGPDPMKVAAAAKFVPFALQVTRTLDLSGEGGAGQNQAQLTGAVVMPRALAPQRWGQVRIEEAVDARGNDLKLPEPDDESPMDRFQEDKPDEDDEEGKQAEDAELRHVVMLSFQPPEWKVKEIARIKGSITLQYFAGSQVVKISNAIPANWIHEMKSEDDFEMNGVPKSISDPKLAEIGLPMGLMFGMAQGPVTTLMFHTAGGKVSVADAQVYDADGRPWPTLLRQRDFTGDDSLTIMVAGKPKAPLSLALVASGAGPSVTVPILIEKVPVGAK